METEKVKKFDKLLFQINPDQMRLSYVLWLGIVCVLFMIMPVEEFKIEGLHIQGIFFRGIFILFSTYVYMKSYVYIKESRGDASIYKKLSYCPISTKHIVKMRFIYLVRYTFRTSIILVVINCIFCLGCYHYVNIDSFLYPIFIVLFFGFLPISFSLILEIIRGIVSKNKNIGCLAKIILFIIIFKYITFLWGICFGQYIDFSKNGITITRDAFTYNEYFYEPFCIPDVDDLAKYKNISYQRCETLMLIFSSEATSLVVEYDDETYYKEKDTLEKEYVFLDNKKIIPQNEFTIGSYNFRVVEKYRDFQCEFPKFFGIVGTSDKNKSIAYLHFSDFDLDVIDESMEDFVKMYFRYDFK